MLTVLILLALLAAVAAATRAGAAPRRRRGGLPTGRAFPKDRSARPSPGAAAPVYVAHPLLSGAEHRFYHALRRAVRRDAKIMVKVRLADLARPQVFSWGVFQPLAMKHVDFVLCAPETLAVLAVLELDDRSHGRADRRARDQYVDGVLAQAGLPVLHVPAAGHYDPAALRTLLCTLLGPLWGGDHAPAPATGAPPAVGPLPGTAPPWGEAELRPLPPARA